MKYLRNIFAPRELVKGGEHYKKGEALRLKRRRSAFAGEATSEAEIATAEAEQRKAEPAPKRATCEALDKAYTF